MKGRGDGRAIEFAERATLEEVARVARDAAMDAAAEKIAKIQVVNKTIYQRATREVLKEPMYRDCLHSADGLRAVNQALTAGAESAGEGGMSSADATQR